MIRLTRKTKQVHAMLSCVAVRNGFSMIQQSLANPKLIPAAITLDRSGCNLKDFGVL